MVPELVLYTRTECCLCDQMKAVVHEVARRRGWAVAEIDIDSAAELRDKYGSEVPVLLINGRKAFKFRVSARQLERTLKRGSMARAVLGRLRR